MKKLSPAAQQKAVTFLRDEGRPLEQALYAFHFEHGAARDVLAELARFQNPDGGFGHGLEPDVRLPGSSVIATTIAFQRLREIKAPADHPLIANGCRYLRETCADLNWRNVPPQVNDAPHAPWWFPESDVAKGLSNPRAEVLGYLYEYAAHFPDDLRQKVTASVMDYLLAQPDNLEMHDLSCYVRLYETAALPEPIKARLFDKLRRVAAQVVARDPAQWRAYGLPPLQLVNGPDSPFAPDFREALEANLDFLIEQQTAPGYWAPNWTWGDLWPEIWPQAERDWRSVLTLNALCTLRRFGRIGA